MSHSLTEQLAAIRVRHEIAAMRAKRQGRRTDALLFVFCVAAGLTLLVTVALQAPPSGWFPL